MEQQFGKFKVEYGDDTDRLHISFDGIYLIVNKTSEGLILDVVDEKLGDVISSVSVDNEQLYPCRTYREEVENKILSIDSTQDVTIEFLDQALEDEVFQITAVESFFNDCSFDISTLIPLQGKVSGFQKEVRKLDRPYIFITNENYQLLMDGQHDYYLTSGGKVVTFGIASTAGFKGMHALCPLSENEANKILHKNNFQKAS